VTMVRRISKMVSNMAVPCYTGRAGGWLVVPNLEPERTRAG